MSLADRSTSAVQALLASLDSMQRVAATAPFDVADHRRWTYLPGGRPGLALARMTADQQVLALGLLDAGASEAGAGTARAVVELDMTGATTCWPPTTQAMSTEAASACCVPARRTGAFDHSD